MNRSFLRPFLICLASCFSASVAKAEAPQPTGSVHFEAGKSNPQGKLKDYLMPGNLYRFGIFGGAKVDLKFVGAVGLGWDFTFSEHKLKDNMEGHYRRVTWDWQHVPLSFGFLYVKPGLSWVVTNVKIPSLGVDESSIRPELMFESGIRVGLSPNFGFSTGAVAEWAWLDTEKTSAGKDLNITGNYGSWFAGFTLSI